MSRRPHDVLATREARAQLPALLEHFRQAGADAEPVVIGARRRPEAVVLSYERYLQLAGDRERVAAALQRQSLEAGQMLDADEAVEAANEDLQAMRRERRAEHRQRPVRLVVDANALVSAVIAASGPPREIVGAWIDGHLELIASPKLVAEGSRCA